jgi:hypothetical protein
MRELKRLTRLVGKKTPAPAGSLLLSSHEFDIRPAHPGDMIEVPGRMLRPSALNSFLGGRNSSRKSPRALRANAFTC